MAFDKRIFIIIVMGLGVGIIIAHYSGIDPFSGGGNEVPIKNDEGRFYCWWMDNLINSKSFDNFTDYEKALVRFQKDWCIDEPRQSSGILMP